MFAFLESMVLPLLHPNLYLISQDSCPSHIPDPEFLKRPIHSIEAIYRGVIARKVCIFPVHPITFVKKIAFFLKSLK